MQKIQNFLRKLPTILAGLSFANLFLVIFVLVDILPVEVLAQEAPSLGEEGQNLPSGEKAMPKADDDSIFGEKVVKILIGVAVVAVAFAAVYYWIQSGGEPPTGGSTTVLAPPSPPTQYVSILEEDSPTQYVSILEEDSPTQYVSILEEDSPTTGREDAYVSARGRSPLEVSVRQGLPVSMDFPPEFLDRPLELRESPLTPSAAKGISWGSPSSSSDFVFKRWDKIFQEEPWITPEHWDTSDSDTESFRSFMRREGHLGYTEPPEWSSDSESLETPKNLNDLAAFIGSKAAPAGMADYRLLADAIVRCYPHFHVDYASLPADHPPLPILDLTGLDLLGVTDKELMEDMVIDAAGVQIDELPDVSGIEAKALLDQSSIAMKMVDLFKGWIGRR